MNKLSEFEIYLATLLDHINPQDLLDSFSEETIREFALYALWRLSGLDIIANPVLLDALEEEETFMKHATNEYHRKSKEACQSGKDG